MSNGFGPPPGQPAGGQGFGSAPGQPVGMGAAPAQPASGGFLTNTMAANSTTIAKWMKFFGIFYLIFGGIYCLSIVGAIIGWIPILLGLWMLKAAEGLIDFANTGSPGALDLALDKIKSCANLVGILTLIYLALVVLGAIGYIFSVLVFGVAMFGAAAAAGG